ncbi:type III secretion system export apparatus subunit SctU [Burkholderia gladioli]|uniref:type III secretion system export apparatus subunit SctU n=1 Tax=Burkholderia gladioli TaxID=28095 RepID=UPI00163F3876|nr:type III secretion system export apparatus subunit SctU [Burkholderia gladioli]
MSDEKTEEPTDKKLRDARKDGQVSKSSDLADAISMTVAIGFVMAAGAHLRDSMRQLVVSALDFVTTEHSIPDMFDRLYRFGGIALLAVVPLALAAAMAGLMGSAMQVGLQIALKPVMPNLNSLNPGEGLKKIFSIKTVIETAKMIVKAALIFAVMWVVIRGLFPLVSGSIYQPLPELSAMYWGILVKLMMIAAVIFVVVGAADVKLQKMLFMKQMKMSKDEVKREHKNDEGDPMIKGERKRIAREMANSPPPRMARANVVVVNPTHYAVALRYAPDEHPLPVVIAKGMDEAAAAIRRAAAEAEVPIVGNPPVARALYKVGVDEPIPEVLFETIAAILRWVDSIGASREAQQQHQAQQIH